MNIADNFSESLETVLGLKILKYRLGSRVKKIPDPRSGMEKFGFGIRDKQ
jgi:hypothetical protein